MKKIYNSIAKSFTCLVFLLLMAADDVSAEGPELIGFQQLVDQINQRRSNLLYKLAGKTYQLQYNQEGNYSLHLTPIELFSIEKTNGNQFTVTIVNPRALWKKHKKKPFKIKWKIDEIVTF